MSTKCRKTFPQFLVIGFLLGLSCGLIGCSNDDFNIPEKPLEGKIANVDWNSDKANAYNFSGGFNYEVKLLSSAEPGSDPCSAPSPSNPHLSAVFRPAEGSFSLSTVLIDPNQVVVRIHTNPSTEFIVNNGYMEVYLIDNGRIYGYIQAILDDENTVEGSFEAIYCN